MLHSFWRAADLVKQFKQNKQINNQTKALEWHAKDISCSVNFFLWLPLFFIQGNKCNIYRKFRKGLLLYIRQRCSSSLIEAV